mmetsp:Transcript_97687/g.173095  ORF Transcript_97687/g.173095 Transcript_97687/m.173095 type:complete len:171 (+) Transcript_97687:62-574(+)
MASAFTFGLGAAQGIETAPLREWQMVQSADASEDAPLHPWRLVMASRSADLSSQEEETASEEDEEDDRSPTSLKFTPASWRKACFSRRASRSLFAIPTDCTDSGDEETCSLGLPEHGTDPATWRRMHFTRRSSHSMCAIPIHGLDSGDDDDSEMHSLPEESDDLDIGHRM